MSSTRIVNYDTGIEYQGTKISLPSEPKKMPLRSAIDTLSAQLRAEEEPTEINEIIDGFVWDGAYAFNMAMKNRYGIALGMGVDSFFGTTPPQTVSIETNLGVFEQVPWGRVALPSLEGGYIDLGMDLKDGRMVLAITATVKKKFETEIQELATDTRGILKNSSIYRGKSFRIKFQPEPDRRGNPNWMSVVPKFLDVSQASADQLILPKRVEAAVATNLFAPLEHYQRLSGWNIPFKRGVLLAGHYGTGKTLSAMVAAKLANQNSITFIMVSNPEEFAQAVAFARQYQPAVVFCEDIDRVMAGERSIGMDAILNTVDGIDSKACDIMVVLTTNQVELIHQAMIRPGRLDAVIEFERPDTEAVQRLIHMYADGALARDADLDRAGQLLAGQIPAVIREVVERSKLSALRRTPPGLPISLTGDALAESAETMAMQIQLLNREPEHKPGSLELMGREIGEHIARAMAFYQKAAEANQVYVQDQNGTWLLNAGHRQQVQETIQPLNPTVTKAIEGIVGEV